MITRSLDAPPAHWSRRSSSRFPVAGPAKAPGAELPRPHAGHRRLPAPYSVANALNSPSAADQIVIRGAAAVCLGRNDRTHHPRGRTARRRHRRRFRNDTVKQRRQRSVNLPRDDLRAQRRRRSRDARTRHAAAGDCYRRGHARRARASTHVVEGDRGNIVTTPEDPRPPDAGCAPARRVVRIAPATTCTACAGRKPILAGAFRSSWGSTATRRRPGVPRGHRRRAGAAAAGDIGRSFPTRTRSGRMPTASLLRGAMDVVRWVVPWLTSTSP